ncbi:MAG TPA: CDP-alcohol phosphatidyltransferase family protein [Candidatus Paceibacterota bacterium]|nr:CDP-alcohol phosphatidyltransferase family protein [Candidatus Paceibacterota bacterium]
MNEQNHKASHNPVLTFLDRFLDVPEAKVTYLTKATAVDRLLAKTFLKLLPPGITPNDITKFRLLSVPFIGVLLGFDFFASGTVLFLFAAFSDALDGALARTQRKITTWGTLYDPIADKLLIGLVSVIIISKYVSTHLALAIVLIEVALVSSAYYRYKGRVVPAKTMGKSKMILQCVGIIVLLLSILFNIPALLAVATWILYGAVVFGLLSLFVFRSI